MESCSSYRSSGHGYGSLTELTEVPGTSMEALRNPQKFRVGTRMLYPYPYPHPGIFTGAYPYPGYCATSVQNLQKFRVRVPRVWFCTYLTEHNLFTHVQKFRVGIRMWYRYPNPHPGMFKRAYTYPGYCATDVQNLQEFRVRVWMYRTYRSSGYG